MYISFCYLFRFVFRAVSCSVGAGRGVFRLPRTLILYTYKYTNSIYKLLLQKSWHALPFGSGEARPSRTVCVYSYQRYLVLYLQYTMICARSGRARRGPEPPGPPADTHSRRAPHNMTDINTRAANQIVIVALCNCCFSRVSKKRLRSSQMLTILNDV